jgi:hypothetical protein
MPVPEQAQVAADTFHMKENRENFFTVGQAE